MKGLSSIRGLLVVVVLAARLRAQEKPAGEPEKSANWLVDAMAQQPAGARDDSKTGVAPGEAGRMAKATHAGTKPEDEDANPLSSYLKTWITPRDYELLKPKGSAANAPGVTVGTGRDVTAPTGLTQGMQANPYVADTAPSVTAKPKTPPNPPIAAPPASASMAAKDDAAPAKAAGPPADVRKAQDDAKYFPQLKRF
jgi:hypothetical protein